MNMWLIISKISAFLTNLASYSHKYIICLNKKIYNEKLKRLKEEKVILYLHAGKMQKRTAGTVKVGPI